MAPELPDLRVFVERLVEPYTAMPLLGVGGHWLGHASPESFAVEVRYDGVAKSRAEVRQLPRPKDLAPGVATDQRIQYHFSTQLPLEADARRVDVVLVGVNLTLHSVDLTAVAPRGSAAPTSAKSLPARAVHALTSGQLLSLWRWHARMKRFRAKLTHAKLRIRHKLLARHFRPRPPHDAYVANTAITPAGRAAMEREQKAFAYRPRFSILMPVYNVEPKWLDVAIQSVRGQIYDNWELCLADDASDLPALKAYLDRIPADPRIHVVRRPKNGHICAATNSAAMHASGTFVALLDNDDLLAPDALFEVAKLLQRHPEADVVYTDEDKIDAAGRRYDPQFKPDWSREMLLAYNYFNHFTCIRRSVFEKVGRFRLGYEGSQDHDLLLRIVGETDRVFHVPKVLYHWRSLPTSTAASAGVKPFVHTSGRKAVEDYLYRERIDAVPYQPAFAERLGLPINLLEWPDDVGSVAIVLLSDGNAKQLKRCIDSIVARTDYRSFRVVGVVGARDKAAIACLETLAEKDQRIEMIVQDESSKAARLNAVVEMLSDDFVLFLDPSLEIADARWLSRLAGYCTMPGVGATGGAIASADGKRLHAGVVLGMRDGIAPANAFHGFPLDHVSYYFQAEIARPVSAVTSRCLLTRRKQFDTSGGFDATRFGDGLFDVDYCRRLLDAGSRTLYVASAELLAPDVRVATADDDRCDDPVELNAFRIQNGRPVDPFYNPNLSEGRAFEVRCDGPLPSIGSPPMRVMVAAHNLNNPEGAPRYLYEIVAGLKRRGRVVPSVWSPLGGKGADAYHRDGIPVSVGETPESKRFVDGQWTPAEYDTVQRNLTRELKRQRPDAVVCNTLLTFPVVEAAARLGIPAVWIIHESYSVAHRDHLFSRYGRGKCEAAFGFASRVVPASHDTAALFAGLNTRGNFTVLHNGLEAGPFDDYQHRVSKGAAAANLPGRPDRMRVIAVGTVCERKGQHTLVEAAARLKSRRDEFAVYLVGARDQVPYASYVRHLVEQHGLGETVHLIPETDNVHAFYRAADVFVCTSHMETFSRAILEAEAFGLPIVSTPCEGVREQVFWNQNALKFDKSDGAKLACHLATLLDDPKLRAAMGRKSRAAFENHLSYDEMLDRYERVLLSAAGRGRVDAVTLRASGVA